MEKSQKINKIKMIRIKKYTKSNLQIFLGSFCLYAIFLKGCTDIFPTMLKVINFRSDSRVNIVSRQCRGRKKYVNNVFLTLAKFLYPFESVSRDYLYC